MTNTTWQVWTVGHSTRTITEFVELLSVADVELVVDVRRAPRSRSNPQYNGDVLPEELAPFQIGYRRIAELGGFRKKSPVAESVNAFWKNRSFHNYADYAVWWKCHRRIIADYLINAGKSVFHLLGEDEVAPASMTEAAVPDEGRLRYPAPPL